jgi:uncharacterized membrane protein YagU involved in acid resistance
MTHSALTAAGGPAHQSRLRAIATTALLAGTLDITAACTQAALTSGISPAAVLRYVASGVFGKAAFVGGAEMAVWGLVFHYLIASVFTVVYFWLSARLSVLVRHPVLAGLGYGLVVWSIMNLLVVPASATPKLPFQPLKAAVGAGIIMVCIGLPIALRAARYYTHPS